MIIAIALRLTGAFAIWYVLTYGLSWRQKDPVSHGRKVAAWVAASVVITTPSMHRNGPDLAVFILINGLVLGGVAFVVGYLWRKFRPVKELIASASPVMPVTSNSASTSQIVVAEKTDHSERSRRSNTPDTTEKIATKTSLNTVSSQSDEEFFAIAFQEVNSGNTVQGLWAKCFAETDGDENKTKARYLSARASQLGAENAAIQFEAERVARMRSLKAEVEPEMVTLPKGQFVMGSPNDEVGRSQHVVPQHMVHIDYEFAVGKYPVTFDQWDLCVKDGGTKYSPSDNGWGRGSRPVINVSWDDIQLYLSWLSNITGNTYRFLSEAEWEYAARAGSQTTYSFGDDEKELGRYAWLDENSGRKNHPVGEKLPNAFGLYDMYGNVYEWTQDCWHENYKNAPTDGSVWTTGDCSQRVVRGGSWIPYPQYLSADFRYGYSTAFRSGYFGFRVARTD